MTDLERAQEPDAWTCPKCGLYGTESVHDSHACVDDAGAEAERAWPKRVMEEVERACEEAYARGAAEMRELALEAARDGVRAAFAERRDQEFIEEYDVIASIRDAFASTFPLTPEGPA